jgi:hypothetical protein
MILIMPSWLNDPGNSLPILIALFLVALLSTLFPEEKTPKKQFCDWQPFCIPF